MKGTKQRSFLSNLFFLLFINLLIKPVYIFLIDRGVQNSVGTEQWGDFFLLMTTSLLFTILLDMGLTAHNSRLIASNPKDFLRYFPSFLWSKLGLIILYWGISFTYVYQQGYWEWGADWLLPLFLNQILLSMLLYFRSSIAAFQHFRADAWLSVVDRLILIILGSAMLFGGLWAVSIQHFIYLQLLGYVLALIIAVFYLYRIVDWNNRPANRLGVLRLLKDSLPYASLVLLMTLYYKVDSQMLDYLLPEESSSMEIGIYGAAYRLLEASNNFSLLFANLLLPLFVALLSKKSSVAALCQTSFASIYLFSAGAAIGGIFYAEEILSLLYTEANTYWVAVFEYLMLGLIPISATYIFGTLLTANANLWFLNIISGIAVVLNIILNSYLIPINAAEGAAMATFYTQLFIVSAQIVYCYRIFSLDFLPRLMGKLLLYTLVLIGLHYAISAVLPLWYWSLLLATLLSLVVAFGLGIIDPKALLGIVKHKKESL